MQSCPTAIHPECCCKIIFLAWWFDHRALPSLLCPMEQKLLVFTSKVLCGQVSPASHSNWEINFCNPWCPTTPPVNPLETLACSPTQPLTLERCSLLIDACPPQNLPPLWSEQKLLNASRLPMCCDPCPSHQTMQSCGFVLPYLSYPHATSCPAYRLEVLWGRDCFRHFITQTCCNGVLGHN